MDKVLPKVKLLRITTVPMALKHLLQGQMKYMQSRGFEVVMVSADGRELKDVVASEGCRHQVVPMSREINLFGDLLSLWQMYRFIKKEKPTIVHTHTPKAGLIGMLAAKLAGTPIRIHTIAGLRFMTTTGLLKQVLIAMERVTAWCATEVWPNSFSIQRFIIDNQIIESSKLRVVGAGSSNGIDLCRFCRSSLDENRLEQIKNSINYQSDLQYLVCVGRIVKDKGIEELLLAFREVYKRKPTARLVLIGKAEDGLDPISPSSKALLHSQQGIIQIEWSDSIEYYLSLAYLLVHPSHREGFPNVLLQAAAMNCPVVCSDIPGNIDIVEHQVTGFVFEAKNAGSLQTALLWALDHPEQLSTFATALYEKVSTQFERQQVHAAIFEKYQQHLASLQV